MKTIILTPVALMTLLAGCAMASPPVVLDAVGPEVRGATRAAPEGALVVFSGIEGHQMSNPEDYYSHYSDYEIWAADGSKRLQLVANHRFPLSDDEPTRVHLAPGRYLVKAMAASYNWVEIPVVVSVNRVTTIHLDGALGKDKAKASPDMVYLPDGEIVGSRAPGQNTASAAGAGTGH